MKISTSLLALFIIGHSALFGQHYPLAELLSRKQIIPVNRAIELSQSLTGAVALSEGRGEGIAWIKDANFSSGTIEIRLKGQDVFQRSFLGVAFHGLNDSTYDAVYFRPFNFLATDSLRKIHAVQYISHPEFPWKKLRTERNGIFEKALITPPDPNDWFKARIVVDCEAVAVFVNEDTTPSLVVKKLNTICDGKIGIWTGDGSGGEFYSLTITNKKN